MTWQNNATPPQCVINGTECCDSECERFIYLFILLALQVHTHQRFINGQWGNLRYPYKFLFLLSLSPSHSLKYQGCHQIWFVELFSYISCTLSITQILMYLITTHSTFHIINIAKPFYTLCKLYLFFNLRYTDRLELILYHGCSQDSGKGVPLPKLLTGYG